MAEASTCIGHEPCPKCGSQDNLARYDDGHGYCFGCEHYEPATDGSTTGGDSRARSAGMSGLQDGTFSAIPARGLTEETCRKFRYTLGQAKHPKTKEMGPVQIATYCDEDGKPVAQKLRWRDKAMQSIGDTKRLSTLLYGRHLWRDGGKKIVVTEGEIDALSVSQLQDNKWPVVSIPNGASGAAKALSANLEWLSKFDEVILMFDDDDAGREAVARCAPLFQIGKCKVARIDGFKDANEALVAKQGRRVIDAVWGAKEFRPDGLVEIDDLLAEAERPAEWGIPWCFPTLTKLTYGRRYGELYAFGAGTGVGKTDLFTQQIEYDVNTLGLRVGVFYLEQPPVETAKRVAGKSAGRRFHVPDAGWTMDELRESLKALSGKVTLYDSFGETDWDVVKSKIRYMAVSLGIRVFYLDHLTAMAEVGNEKDSVEQIMKELAGLTNELSIIIHFVSHLSTPEGKPHEEGGRVMIRHFKGSRSIGFWSFFMFGLERDQQAKDERRRSTTTFRVLKDRYTGQATGRVFGLGYDPETGRLSECPLDDDEDSPFRDETGSNAF